MRIPPGFDPHHPEFFGDSLEDITNSALNLLQSLGCHLNHDAMTLVDEVTIQYLIEAPEDDNANFKGWLDQILEDCSASESPEFLRGFTYGMAQLIVNSPAIGVFGFCIERLVLNGIDHKTGRPLPKLVSD